MPKTTMTHDEMVDAVHDVAQEVDGEVRTNYSGRFMYGEICYGVTCSDPTKAIEAGARLGLTGARQDNMGLDYIVYWPKVKGDEVKDDE